MDNTFKYVNHSLLMLLLLFFFFVLSSNGGAMSGNNINYTIKINCSQQVYQTILIFAIEKWMAPMMCFISFLFYLIRVIFAENRITITYNVQQLPHSNKHFNFWHTSAMTSIGKYYIKSRYTYIFCRLYDKRMSDIQLLERKLIISIW